MKITLIILMGFILSFFLTYIVRKIAIKKFIFDIPNERSSHKIPTPHGGGLAIVITWFIGITYLFFINEIESKLFYALLSGFFLVVIGFIDDLVGVNPLLRFIVQGIVVGLALFFLRGLIKIDFGFFVSSSIVINSFLAFIGLIWFINLYNFLDGIDGYAAVETIFVSGALYLLFSDTFTLILIAATTGFLVWNWQPAKIFMGDVGSTLLGFNVAVFGIYYQNTSEISLITLLILTSAFWFDATLTLFRRWKNKEKLSEAHKKHGYQRIVQAGFSHQKTTLFMLGVNILLGGAAWISHKYPVLNILMLLFTILFLFFITKLIDNKKPFNNFTG